MTSSAIAVNAVPQHERPRYAVDLSIYSLEALFRACYRYTDRCYLFLDSGAPGIVEVSFQPKQTQIDPQQLIAEFANELIDQRVRADLARETKTIRELIVAQAFGEARLKEPTP